jgi:xylosyl alpha-1,3-xylosyltransferase
LEDAVVLSQDAIEPIKKHFSSSNSYYSQTVFFLSVVMHRILPFHNRVLYVDVDVVFQTDIGILFGQFSNFSGDNLIGLANEQQPVYRHVLQSYRKSHPKTTFGSAPPIGQPGFNSGVVMFDLGRMRGHKPYLAALTAESIANLTEKYSFQGHLGDQDLYTLLSFEHPEWFYVIPCEWNRQLCVWWKNNGYADVFKAYHACSKTPLIYHGNCNTKIPLIWVSNVTEKIN